MVKKSLAIVLTTLLVLPQFAFARYTPKPGVNFFSIQQDIELGKENAAQVEKQMPLVKDAQLNQYIQRLGQKLVAHAPQVNGTQYPFTFKIVNQKEINAFALPGGPIYVNLGTIQAADTEAQLAGVIGHEMGHVIMRHSTNQASKQMLAQAPLAVLGGKFGGGVGQLAQMGIGFGLNSVFLKYSRQAESQADLIGTDIIHDSGYDPRAMAQFFEKLESQGGARGPQFLSDHPNPGNRAQAVAAEAATLPKMNYQGDSPDFRAIKQKVSGSNFAAQQAQQGQGQGGAQGGTIARSKDIQPSSNYKPFDHSAFTMTYPDNWIATGDANSSVTIAPKGGAAGDAVAFGAVVNGVKPQQGASLEDATSQLAAQIQKSGGLKQQGNGENFTLNGKPARSIVFLGPSPLQGEQERDWLVTQQRQDGTLMYVVFVSPEKDFESLKPTFQKMLKSFKLK
jgi:Zn-dependent protease with chaperone function